MLRARCSRTLIAMAAVSLAAAAAACRGGAAAPVEKTETQMIWRPVGTWSGRGNRQTESFEGETGALRVTWEARPESADSRPGPFRLIAHSAISGRELAEVVNRQGPGSGIGYVSTEPHTFYISVESSGLAWTFSIDEGLAGEVVTGPGRR